MGILRSLSVREKACLVPRWVSWIAFRNTQLHYSWLALPARGSEKGYTDAWSKGLTGACWLGAFTGLTSWIPQPSNLWVGWEGRKIVWIRSYFVLLKNRTQESHSETSSSSPCQAFKPHFYFYIQCRAECRYFGKRGNHARLRENKHTMLSASATQPIPPKNLLRNNYSGQVELSY